MRALAFFLSLVLCCGAVAQEKPVKAKKKQVAHAKPTPEQIRKFNQLQRKQQQEPQKR